MDKIENFEIVRSFSQKKNMGNYETQDYFASYKAVVEKGADEKELQIISDMLAEKAENDVLSKVDPTKFISRQQTLAEYRAKISSLEKKVSDLTSEINKLLDEKLPF